MYIVLYIYIIHPTKAWASWEKIFMRSFNTLFLFFLTALYHKSLTSHKMLFSWCEIYILNIHIQSWRNAYEILLKKSYQQSMEYIYFSTHFRLFMFSSSSSSLVKIDCELLLLNNVFSVRPPRIFVLTTQNKVLHQVVSKIMTWNIYCYSE